MRFSKGQTPFFPPFPSLPGTLPTRARLCFELQFYATPFYHLYSYSRLVYLSHLWSLPQHGEVQATLTAAKICRGPRGRQRPAKESIPTPVSLIAKAALRDVS